MYICIQITKMQEDMGKTNVRSRRTVHPISFYRELVQDMDDSQKLELVSIIIDSLKSVVAPPPMQSYTMNEINAMIDQSETEIAAGRVYDFEEVMDKMEKEFAEEDRELTITESV